MPEYHGKKVQFWEKAETTLKGWIEGTLGGIKAPGYFRYLESGQQALSQIYFLRRLRSFNRMLRVFQQSIVESGLPFAVVCGGSAIKMKDANGQKLGLWLALSWSPWRRWWSGGCWPNCRPPWRTNPNVSIRKWTVSLSVSLKLNKSTSSE